MTLRKWIYTNKASCRNQELRLGYIHVWQFQRTSRIPSSITAKIQNPTLPTFNFFLSFPSDHTLILIVTSPFCMCHSQLAFSLWNATHKIYWCIINSYTLSVYDSFVHYLYSFFLRPFIYSMPLFATFELLQIP